jgi:2-amino-4-hydroxy-6-hydroxymethyldihydropteridine diphosphokinase
VVCLSTVNGVFVYLSLGTNLGDRLSNLAAARAALPPQVQVKLCSSIYQTEPWGFTGQPAFLNQVLQTQTNLTPVELLAYIKNIETLLGRTPTFRYGPRLIDLDILMYADLVLDIPSLTIPHQCLSERAFVLVPLAEIAPDLCHPINRLTTAEMLEKLVCSGISLYAA